MFALLLRPSGWRAPLRHPVTVGAGLAGLLVAAVLLSQFILHRQPFGPAGSLRDLRISLLHCLLAAYVPAACLRVLASAERTVQALRPQAAHNPAAGPPLRAMASLPTRALLGCVALGLGLALIGPYLMEPGVAGPLAWWNPRTWAPETVWHRVLGIWIGVWTVWFGYAVIQISQHLSRLARQLGSIDLFDLSPLEPFAQQGLTNALLAAGLLSLNSLFVVDFGVSLGVALGGPIIVGLIGTALLLPVRGVHLRILQAKRAELAWCQATIQEEQRAVRAEQRTTTGGRLADLLAYRALVEGVREWPFDSPALRRIALYLLIPFASWILSTLAQRALDRYVFGP